MHHSTPTFDIRFSGDADTSTINFLQKTTFTMSASGFTPTDVISADECRIFRTEQTVNITNETSESPIRLLIASVTLLENVVVILALLHSWKTLQQNLYIFALSIAVSDGLLGFIHVTNSIVVGVAFKDDTQKVGEGMGPSSWFYLIRAAALLVAQVASTGNAACLVIAFKRYVDALAPSGQATSKDGGGTHSKILSRKTSYSMTLFVWTISVVLGGVIPLFWNCGKNCACFLEAGVHQSHINATECFEKHGCSYIFPPIKSASYLMCSGIFFTTLTILVTTCVQVVLAAGGVVALLPYRLHKYYVRRRKSVEDQNNLPMRLRKHSVQMAYMRDMMHFMFLITLTFVICKLPAALLILVESVTNQRLNIPEHLGNFLILLSYFGSILNPIIFGTTLHGMRQALKKLITPCCTTTISVSIGTQLHSDENTTRPQISTTV